MSAAGLSPLTMGQHRLVPAKFAKQIFPGRRKGPRPCVNKTINWTFATAEHPPINGYWARNRRCSADFPRPRRGARPCVNKTINCSATGPLYSRRKTETSAGGFPKENHRRRATLDFGRIWTFSVGIFRGPIWSHFLWPKKCFFRPATRRQSRCLLFGVSVASERSERRRRRDEDAEK